MTVTSSPHGEHAGTRHTADTITSDALDELYDNRDRLQAQLSDMTRDRDRWKWYRDDAERRVRVQRQRAGQAEAAVGRVSAECDRIETAVRANPTAPDFDGAYLAAIKHIRTALAEPGEA